MCLGFFEDICLPELYRDIIIKGILPCHSESLPAYIPRLYLCLGQCLGYGYGYASAACPYVEDM